MAWNILIVDDSSLTRKRMRRIIEMTDLDVGQFLDAENGAEALKILEESNIDLVLSDLNMPEMSGAESQSLSLLFLSNPRQLGSRSFWPRVSRITSISLLRPKSLKRLWEISGQKRQRKQPIF